MTYKSASMQLITYVYIMIVDLFYCYLTKLQGYSFHPIVHIIDQSKEIRT